jgi:hypothetical protein
MQSTPNNAIKCLIQSLPTLPKSRLFELWNEAFGRPAGKSRLK